MNVLQILCLESLDFSAFKAIHLFNVLIIVGADGIATSTSSRNFSLRAYSLLMALLAGTVCIVSYFMLVEDLRSYVRVNRWVNIASLAIHLSSIVVVVSVLAISRRTFFQNLSLGLHTMCQGVFVGTMTSFYDVDVVLNTGGITGTAAVSLGLGPRDRLLHDLRPSRQVMLSLKL